MPVRHGLRIADGLAPQAPYRASRRRGRAGWGAGEAVSALRAERSEVMQAPPGASRGEAPPFLDSALGRPAYAASRASGMVPVEEQGAFSEGSVVVDRE